MEFPCRTQHTCGHNGGSGTSWESGYAESAWGWVEFLTSAGLRQEDSWQLLYSFVH